MESTSIVCGIDNNMESTSIVCGIDNLTIWRVLLQQVVKSLTFSPVSDLILNVVNFPGVWGRSSSLNSNL